MQILSDPLRFINSMVLRCLRVNSVRVEGVFIPKKSGKRVNKVVRKKRWEKVASA